MRDLSTVVDQLRTVRAAQRKFLGMWAVEEAVIQPALDRMAADLASALAQGCANGLWPLDGLAPLADEP